MRNFVFILVFFLSLVSCAAIMHFMPPDPVMAALALPVGIANGLLFGMAWQAIERRWF